MSDPMVNETEEELAIKGLKPKKRLFCFDDCYSLHPDPLLQSDEDYDPRKAYGAPTKLKLPLK